MPDNDKIEIALAGVGDIADIKKVELACGLSPWSVGSYELELQRSDAVVLSARDAADVVGFIAGRVPPEANAEAEIYNIGVLQEARGQGIGGLLIEEFRRISQARNARAIWLEVRVSNVQAIDFYRSHGFSIEGSRKNFYSSPVEDAALMCLRLGASGGT